MKHPIPDAALDDRLAFIGTSGSGKTYSAKGCVERLLAMKHRVVIVDPLDVWYGLRLKPDGKTGAFQIGILGGRHADLPLTESAGGLIGEAVAKSTESCIVSLTGLKTSAARQHFMHDFLDMIYERTNPDRSDPYHIVFDEADLWAPQKPYGREAMLCHLMEEIVRRGRVKGFIPWLISQRPAVLNKNVLSQADGLIALKLTASQDRNAIKAWVASTADEGQWGEIDKALPTMQRGSAIAWLPGRGILETVSFPENKTFDSSRTPKRGEKKLDTTLAPLDLGALKAKLATIEEEAKANDPKALRAEIARLTALTKAPTNIPQNIPPDPKALEIAEQRGYSRGWSECERQAHDQFEALKQLAGSTFKSFSDAYQSNLRGETLTLTPRSFPPSGSPATGMLASSPTRAPTVPPVARKPSPVASGDGSLGGVKQTILNSVAEMEALCRKAPPRTLVAMMAGYKNVKSTGFAKALSGLSMDGMVNYPDSGTICLTVKGLTAARPRAAALTTEEVHAKAIDILGETAGKILGHVLAVYPGVLEREVLAERSGYQNVKSTGFAKALSRLSSLGFVSYPSTGTAKAGEILFP